MNSLERETLMRNIFSSKKLAAVAAGAVLLTGTGVAYAYWTTSGSGDASVTAGTAVAADDIVLTQSGVDDELYPGGPAADIEVTAHNPALFDQYVGEVTATPTYPDACDADNWTWTPNDADVYGVVDAGLTSDPYSVGTLALDETGQDQDSCKDAEVTFVLVSAGEATS